MSKNYTNKNENTTSMTWFQFISSKSVKQSLELQVVNRLSARPPAVFSSLAVDETEETLQSAEASHSKTLMTLIS